MSSAERVGFPEGTARGQPAPSRTRPRHGTFWRLRCLIGGEEARMSKWLVYLFLVLRPRDQETLERVLEELKQLEAQHNGGCDEQAEPSCN